MTNKDFIMPKRIVVDYSYNIPLAKGKDTVRFLFAPVQDHDKPYVLIVIAQPIISPINYPVETYSLIIQFLDHFSVDIKDVDIILDFEERSGTKRPYLDRWKFKDKNGNDDSFESLDRDDLPPAIKKLRDEYYKRGEENPR